MAFLAPALPFIAAAGSLVQGAGGLMAGQHNSKALRAQGREELRAAGESERELRKDARRKIGAQLAAQWGNGMEGGTGTSLDALRESELEAVLDAREVRRQGTSRAASLRSQAKQEERQGYFAAAEGLLGAASGFGGMKNDWAQARVGSSG
jgi:hypothetical protein